MAKKLWGGRFQKELHPTAKEFSYSLQVDAILGGYDIQVNAAHVAALHQQGYLAEEEFEKLENCLNELLAIFHEDPQTLFGEDEDIHSCIERNVTERLGDLGKKMHTGKSRNDQVITDMRLYMKDQVSAVYYVLQNLLQTLWEKADQYKKVVFPGFTHFQPAQPVLFAHHLLAYYEKFDRDLKRFGEVFATTDVCPLGSGALAGNNYGLDRKFLAEKLGFSQITHNSMDAVSDRDFLLEFLSASSICMTHLSRFCEEIICWSSPLIGFIELSDAFTTGSSLMPQKKNPDIAELIRGKTGRVLGHFVSLQHTLKALPLTYNRDLQEDKELTIDTAETLLDSLECFVLMIESIELKEHAINQALQKGYLTATDLADYLVGKGIPFRECHELVGKIVAYAYDQGKELQELSLTEFQQFHGQIDGDVYEALTLENAVAAKNLVGGTAFPQVEERLKQLRRNKK